MTGGDTGATAAPHSVLDGDAYKPEPRVPWLLRKRMVRGLLAYLLLAVLVGCLAGVVWNWVTTVPSYTIQSDGQAVTSERGLALFFDADGWFSVVAAVCGLGLGGLAWLWFRRLGWPVVLLSALVSLAAGTMCWMVGVALGPRNFAVRLSQAVPGQQVPIDFALRSDSAMLLWPLFATIPVMFASAFARDDEGRPHRSRARRGGRTRRPVTGATAAGQD